MSELSYLEKLMDGVEVEWKTLEDITLRTSNIKWREAIRSYRYIDLTSVDIATKKIIETTEITKNNAPSRAQKLVDENDVIFATTRPTQQRFCLIDSEYAGAVASTGYCILRAKKDQVLPKWILHWISTSDFKKHVEENQSGSAYPAISDSKVKECLIPIPCPDNPEKSLAIQSEIVRILDKFTALTAELTAELNMRKKQYNYYLDQSLSFKEGEVEWKTLGEVAVIGTGNHDTQDAIEHGKYIFYARGREPLKLNVFDFDETAIITAGDGAGVGKVFHYAKGKYALHQRAYRIVPNAFMNPRFVYHYITAYFFTYIQKASVSSSVTSLRRPMFLKFPIPVPPSEEQARIVEILDKFDTLTNSITEGLPREIELRQKQYEYYRDLLFSFPKPETVSN
ncbi:restriction endonuclease subunit S [Escherichia coli]|nr:restriction endonuclease subunit S [Escherichia coli]MBB8949166.1 restriction endonuclease subunit S [Escherichia coli]